MWKKLLLAAGIYFCLLQIAMAQNAVIEGIVKDAQTHEPLISVNVVVSEFLGTVTDSDGRFQISVPAGEYTLSFHYLGYTTSTIRVKVSAGETTFLPVNLSQGAIEGEIVVVTAGKFEQDLGELTVSMEVIRPNIIENKNTTYSKPSR